MGSGICVGVRGEVRVKREVKVRSRGKMTSVGVG